MGWARDPKILAYTFGADFAAMVASDLLHHRPTTCLSYLNSLDGGFPTSSSSWTWGSILLALGAYTSWKVLRASPPCRVEGTWQALWRGPGEKIAPPLSNPTALIARALQTSGSTYYLHGWALLLLRPHSGASSTCNPVNRVTFGNRVIFLTVLQE